MREKLIKLLDIWMEFETAEQHADYLIANGVTVQELDGCEYCKQFDDPWEAPMIAKEDDEPDRGIYLYNGFLCANGGEFVDAKVNFCPICGRRLPQPQKGE